MDLTFNFFKNTNSIRQSLCSIINKQKFAKVSCQKEKEVFPRNEGVCNSMEKKIKKNPYYPMILICLVILVIAGSYFVYYAYLPPGDLHQNQQEDTGRSLQPTSAIPASTQPVFPTTPVLGSTQDPGSLCDPKATAPRIPAPIDTSVPIRDPMPGIRFSLNESDSDKTIVLGKGDVFEINLVWRPGHGFHWIVPVSGCGLDLVNDGYYSEGADIWSTSGNYRARYRAVSPGTSVLNGKYLVKPDKMVILWFNLTVIVK
jgi:predicted secreted protein